MEGSNDFPISGAHATFGLGIGLAAGSRLFFYGVEFLYHLQGTTTLTDPSDNDRVEIDTYRYLTGVLRVGTYLLHTSSLRLYLEGGGGISHTPDKDVRIYTSEQDYETEIGPPEKEFPLTFFAGAGLELPLSADLALMVGGRWIYLSLEQGQSVIAVRAGLSFSF